MKHGFIVPHLIKQSLTVIPQEEIMKGDKMKIALPVSPSKTQYFVNQAYIDYIADAGYEPVLVSPRSNIEEMAATCHGLILPGGIDIDPIFYNEDNIASFSSDPEKDDFERRLFYTFKDNGKLVFGICRGFQLIMREFLRHNMEYEKRYVFCQHINKHNPTNDLSLARTQPSHSVAALKNRLYGDDYTKATRMFVNSMHHQCVAADLPNSKAKGKPLMLTTGDLTVLAFTRIGLDAKDFDVIVEGVEIRNWLGGGIRAVQWHPEELKDYALLQTFYGTEEQAGNAILIVDAGGTNG